MSFILFYVGYIGHPISMKNPIPRYTFMTYVLVMQTILVGHWFYLLVIHKRRLEMF